MIVLKISNASDLVASKLGQFVERLTPAEMDDVTVESLVIKKMIENLKDEGIKGEIASLKGLDVDDGSLLLQEGFKVRNHQFF